MLCHLFSVMKSVVSPTFPIIEPLV